MAAFVLAGRVDSSEYSRAEMLGDYLCSSLPHFKLHKIPVDPSEWSGWLSQECEERGWECNHGPLLIWRELVDRGGKGLLLGGLIDFERYAEHYYEVRLDVSADLDSRITEENVAALQVAQAEDNQRVVESSTNLCITNASHPLAYHLIHQLCLSGLYSSQGGLAIRLLVNSLDEEDATTGICMEARDMALPHLKAITTHTSAKDAFADVHVVFLLDYPRHTSPEGSCDGTRTDDSFKEASSLYHRYAQILDFCGNKALRVVISGRYAEIGVAVLAKTATSFAANRFTAPSELASYQAKAIIASRLNVNPSKIENVIICGRSSGEGAFADLSQTCVHGFASSITGPPWYSRPIKECIHDHDWLRDEFHSLLLKRSTGEGYGPTGPIVAESVRLVQFLHCWVEGGTQEFLLSAVLYIDEQLEDLPKLVALSLPCKVLEGEICIPKDVRSILGEEARTRLNGIAAEIRNELETAMSVAEPSS